MSSSCTSVSSHCLIWADNAGQRGASGRRLVDEIVASLRAAGTHASGQLLEADFGHVARTILDGMFPESVDRVADAGPSQATAHSEPGGGQPPAEHMAAPQSARSAFGPSCDALESESRSKGRAPSGCRSQSRRSSQAGTIGHVWPDPALPTMTLRSESLAAAASGARN